MSQHNSFKIKLLELKLKIDTNADPCKRSIFDKSCNSCTMHPIHLNKTSNRNIIILYYGDVILHTISQDNDIIKSIIKNLYRLSKSYDVKSKIKSKNKKEGGEQTVSDVKNLPVTLPPNISRIEKIPLEYRITQDISILIKWIEQVNWKT